MAIDWQDAESLALLLQKVYPDVDPSVLELPDLSQMILSLPGAGSRGSVLDAKLLEAVQEAWNEEYADERI